MPQLAWFNKSEARSRFVVILLLLTMVFVVVLAFQGLQAARSHRATAENVLHDYAAAAVHEYAGRVEREWEYYGFYPVFQVLVSNKMQQESVPLAQPSQLISSASELQRAALQSTDRFFRMSLPDGQLEFSDESGDATLDTWLRDTLRVHAETAFQSTWRSAILVRTDTAAQIFIYSVYRDTAGTPNMILGFQANLEGVRSVLATSAEHDPLLPPTLIRDLDPDSVMTVRMMDGSGRTLYSSANTTDGTPATSQGPRFYAKQQLDGRFGGLAAFVSLRPEAAERLIIGGLPRSNLPLLLGLLVVTIGLVIAALYQLRREQELLRLHTEFISNVSHELRTPLAQIRMFAETLVLGRVRTDKERQRSLEIIDQEARRLTNLVENVLHFSRAERGSIQVNTERVRAAQLVHEVTESFVPLAAAEGSEVRTELNMDVTAELDPAAFRQVLLNLLDNALKYGPRNQTILVTAERWNGSLRIGVDDQGSGVAQKDRDAVWKKFWRHQRHRKEAIAGTGIGLSVVRELITLHGGTAWVEDAPGGGARFMVEFPNARS